MTVFYTDNAIATDYFNPDSIENRGGIKDNIDLSALSYIGGQVEGEYKVAIYLNGDLVAEQNIVFKLKDRRLVPKLTKRALILWQGGIALC